MKTRFQTLNGRLALTSALVLVSGMGWIPVTYADDGKSLPGAFCKPDGSDGRYVATPGGALLKPIRHSPDCDLSRH